MSAQSQAKQVVLQQLPLKYEVRGIESNCPPVMLVHGFTEDRQIWNKIIPTLEKKYRFILPDLPGSGASAANPGLNHLADYAVALEEIRVAENTDRIILIGHSMGGYISLAYAERFPRQLTGLGLFHSTTRADGPEKKAAREKNQDFIRRNGAAVFVRQSLPGLYSAAFRDAHPEEIEEQIARYANFGPETLVLYLEAMKNRPDRTDILRSCDVPVLIIAGEEDKVIPPADMLPLAHLPRISYFHTLPRTAHMGMMENPTLCISCVDHFLEQFTW